MLKTNHLCILETKADLTLKSRCIWVRRNCLNSC